VSGDGLDLAEVQGLAARLARIPNDFRRETRKALQPVGQRILRDAQANASWSSRIPAAIALRVTLAGRRPGIALRVSVGQAPHARVFEGLLGDTFRHPLFGDEPWYAQAARPYALPAVVAGGEQIAEEIGRVVDAIHAKAGLT